MGFDPAYLLWALALVLVIAGILGLALPALPGAPLLFLGLVVAAWAEDFQYVGTGGLIVLGMLAVLTYLADIAAGVFGAKKFGASKQAMIGAGIGAIVGIFFAPLGILLGPFLGALIGELIQQKKLHTAGLSGIGATVGLLLGAIAKLVLAFMMLSLFAFLRFSG
jgi:uncharacterized protein YqgC (DUF456 family)